MARPNTVFGVFGCIWLYIKRAACADLLVRNSETKLWHFVKYLHLWLKEQGGNPKNVFFGLTNPELLISLSFIVCVCVCVCDCVCMLTLPDPWFIHLLLLGLYYFLYTWACTKGGAWSSSGTAPHSSYPAGAPQTNPELRAFSLSSL